MNQASETMREDQNATVREGFDSATTWPGAQGITVREGQSAAGTGALGVGGSFRDYRIVRQLPSTSTEADIFIIEKDGTEYILKLYRYGIEPKNDILRSIKTLSETYPQNFIRVYETDFDEGSSRWFEVQEYAKFGTLQTLIDDRSKLADTQKFLFFNDVARGVGEALNLLHQNNLLHLDIKPSNILLRSLNPLNMVLIDFGIATSLASDMSKKFTQTRGTPMYQSPESWSGGVGRPSDWWGLGMILLEIAADGHPFKGVQSNVIERALATKPAPIPENIDEGRKELLKGLLTRDPDKRWNWEQVARWLGGERGIPQSFETSVVEERKATPFVFMDQSYNTLSDLLAAFTKDNETWKKAEKHLQRGDVRKWLEQNGHFDQVEELEKFLETTRGQHGEMSSLSKSFTVYGKTIVINEDYDKYNSLRQTFEKEAKKAQSKVSEKCLASSLTHIEQIGLNIISDVSQRIAVNQFLLKNQIYDVDYRQFYEGEYNPKISEWQSHAHAIEEKDKSANYIKEEIQSWESQKSQYQLPLFHDERQEQEHNHMMDFINGEIAKLKARLKSTKPSGKELSFLSEIIYDAVLSLHMRCWKIMEQHGVVSSNNVACCLPGNIEKANGTVNNISHMNKDAVLERFPEILLSNPYNPSLYGIMFTRFGDSNGELDKIAAYFGLSQEVEKSKDTEIRKTPAVRSLEQAYKDYQNNPGAITRLSECWKNKDVPDKIRKEYKKKFDELIEEKKSKIKNNEGDPGVIVFVIVALICAIVFFGTDFGWIVKGICFFVGFGAIGGIFDSMKLSSDAFSAQPYIDSWNESLFRLSGETVNDVKEEIPSVSHEHEEDKDKSGKWAEEIESLLEVFVENDSEKEEWRELLSSASSEEEREALTLRLLEHYNDE